MSTSDGNITDREEDEDRIDFDVPVSQLSCGGTAEAVEDPMPALDLDGDSDTTTAEVAGLVDELGMIVHRQNEVVQMMIQQQNQRREWEDELQWRSVYTPMLVVAGLWVVSWVSGVQLL